MKVTPTLVTSLPLTYNHAFNPSAVELLTNGILKYGLFKNVERFPLLHSHVQLAKVKIVRKAHRKRLLGLDIGLDIGLGSSLNVSLNLGSGIRVDDGWDGATTSTLSNSQNDNAWFAQISFGTPGQTLTMAMDTGSADTVLFSTNCTSCQLNNHTAFDTGASATYIPSNTAFTTSYGDGTRMSGTLGRDEVHVTPSLSADAQLLAIITSKQSGASAVRWDGILGLGPDQLSYVEGNVTPLSNMVKANKLAQPLVGVALVKENATSAGGGEYRWGAVNNAYVSGQVVYSPVTSSYYWGVDMAEIYYGSLPIMAAADARRCIVDTATTLIYTSDAAAKNLHSNIKGATLNSQEGAWYLPCDTSLVADVFVEIGGNRWGIPAEDLAFRASGRNDGLCVSGIQGGSTQYTILGDVFIKNHYLVFNYGSTVTYSLSVGIANRTDVRAMSTKIRPQA